MPAVVGSVTIPRIVRTAKEVTNMSNMLRIGNREISYEQAKEMLFPELIPQKGNEDVLSQHPHDKVKYVTYGRNLQRKNTRRS